MNWLKIGIVLFIAVPSMALAREGRSCEMQAKSALARGNHHLVITIEGLFGGVQGRVHKQVEKIKAETGDAYTIRAYSHATAPTAAASCAAAWKRIHGSKLRLTVIGHSLGGGVASMNLAAKLKSKNISIEELLIFDGRHGAELTCGQFGPKYEKPSNVVNATAVFQCGGMPGRSFEEGPGVRNVRAPAGLFAHLNLPTSSTGEAEIERVLGASATSNSEAVAEADELPSSNAEAAAEIPETRPARTVAFRPPSGDRPAIGCKRAGPCTYDQINREAEEERRREQAGDR